MNSLNLTLVPDSDRCEIFSNNTTAIDYLIKTERIKKFTICDRCNNQMSLHKCSDRLHGFVYTCKSRQCQHRKGLFEGKRIEYPKIAISDYLYAIYKWIENHFEKDVIRNLKISKKSYQNIKKNCIGFAKKMHELKQEIKLGGEKTLQVDETVICHGFLNQCPSQMSDDTRGITWLMGIIEENTNEIRLKILNDRTSTTFAEIFKEKIKLKTKIITDGHASYPQAVGAIEGEHVIVNHSQGFKNVEGFHTNNIENLWSLLKYELKRRRGVKKSNIEEFLFEFEFRYRKLRKRSQSEVREVWNSIIDYLFE